VLLRLTHDEPRLVALALTYHLGRPGSELDPRTKQPRDNGIAAVRDRLLTHLDAPHADIELDARGYERLLSAIYGSITELRVQHMRGGAKSTVAGFSEAARRLFPQLAADPAFALDLAESLMMLHRRLERAVRRAGAPVAGSAADGGSGSGDGRKGRRPR